MVSLTTDLQVKIDCNTWASVISSCSIQGRCKLAEDYFDVMLESGVEPNVITWTALVQAIARGENSSKVYILLTKM